MATGLYIHIPYCKRKCKYCSFFSIPNSVVDENYFFQLLEEIESYADKKILIDSIYIGGGTPSLLSESQISRLFEKIKSVFIFEKNCEISVELNPESINEELLKQLKKCGVNRLSFGVQSFDDGELESIGRIHNSNTANNALEIAGKYFDNINIDLMIGLPEQTTSSFQKTISKALNLPITHISVYSLIIEENTPIFEMVNNGLVLPSEDETVEMYDYAVKYLADNSFYRYEISNFAKKGYECKHNLNCWRFHEYIGVGASAHSFFRNERFSNSPTETGFSKKENKTFYKNEETDRVFEYIMLALRTASGVDKKFFLNHFGKDFDVIFSKVLQKEEIKKTCINLSDRFFIKDKYIYVSNSIIVDFLEEIR